MNKLKNNSIIALLLFTGFFVNAQEIIKDTVKTVAPIVNQGGKKKIDGIIATVGEYIILDSEIDKAYVELSSQGNSVKDITRCQLLGRLMEEKLFAHQAVQDSIVVQDAEIKDKMNNQLDYMVEQIGSMENVVKYFKKSTEGYKQNSIRVRYEICKIYFKTTKRRCFIWSNRKT